MFLPSRVLGRAGIARPSDFGVAQALGIALAVLGGALAIWCVAAFATLGKGTPAPFDPPLGRLFGKDYEACAARVHRWWPRLPG